MVSADTVRSSWLTFTRPLAWACPCMSPVNTSLSMWICRSPGAMGTAGGGECLGGAGHMSPARITGAATHASKASAARS